MRLNEIIEKKGITKYRLAKESGVPHATLNDLCSGKTRIEKCSAETLYKLAQALNVPMEAFMEESAEKRAEEERIRAYEYGLPGYLQHDLDAYKEGLKNGSTLMDCLWCELYGSINIAEINDGAITPEHADYLRQKFLWGTDRKVNRKMSKTSFISFCVEYYADHIGKTSDQVYELFKKEKLLDLLETDYEDLHGMGMEYLMQMFDEYLGGKKQ